MPQASPDLSAPDLAVVYEHPAWFEPLFRALDRRGVAWSAVRLQDHAFDPAGSPAPAPVVFNRLAMSSFLREAEHPIFYAAALYEHWEAAGATVINGSAALAVDASKARQMSLIAGLGLAIPATRVVHRRGDLVRAAHGLRFPVVVKPNIGGSGAGVTRYDSPSELAEAAASGATPVGVDGVALVQEYVPARGGRIVRAETLDGALLYALSLETDGATFDLCPADVCLTEPGRPAVTLTPTTLDAETTRAVEAIARAAHLDVGGVEFMIDDRDGEARFYDVNALSNFVADPVAVLGYDPHDPLVDSLVRRIESGRRAAA